MDVYHIQVLCILTGKARHTVNWFLFQFVSKTFNSLVKHGKSLKQDGMVTKNLVACVHNARLHYFFALYDSLHRNNFSRRFCAVFASDWLGSLIYIHSSRGVSLILNCLLMSEGVSSD